MRFVTFAYRRVCQEECHPRIELSWKGPPSREVLGIQVIECNYSTVKTFQSAKNQSVLSQTDSEPGQGLGYIDCGHCRRMALISIGSA